MSWLRVSKQTLCLCGHNDWCMVSEDGKSFLCMRMVSEHPFQMKDGSIGYIHRVNGHAVPPPVKHEKPAPAIDAEAMIYEWLKRTKAEWISRLAVQLGVKASALLELHVCWAESHQAFAFPMRDGEGRVVGIRLRNMIGDKWSVRGSHSGVFLPYCHSDSTAWVVEGASDCAAGRSIGLYAIGRPSCSGGLFHLKTLFDRLQVRRAVIIADNDKPGLEGAEQLVRHVEIPCCVVTLPCKDLREFINLGGKVEMLESLTQSFVWRNITVPSFPNNSGTPSPAAP